MSSTRWGVYGVQAKDRAGRPIPAGALGAAGFWVRWRVEGREHKRTFRQKGHARTWQDRLLNAKLNGWPADERGWPLDPAEVAAATAEAARTRAGHTFASYVTQIWWPIYRANAADAKTVQSHQLNVAEAVDLLRYPPGDLRDPGGTLAGSSIRLADLVADDVRRAVGARRRINRRTRAVNHRETLRAAAEGRAARLLAEAASAGTVRSFAITLGMILRDAAASGHATGDAGAQILRWAPKPALGTISARLVPSLAEVHDLAEVIGRLGPVRDGGPVGQRYVALVLLAGTAGPRPGELVAHRPDWMELGAEPVVWFAATEGVVYLRAADRMPEWTGPRRRRDLKQRGTGEQRTVPLIPSVRDALREHVERGFAQPERTFTSPDGRSPLTWHNLMHLYWRPACEKVFAGGGKAVLAAMPPKTLRKAAITYWSEAGIPEPLAAEWAGHGPEVARAYYLGRSRTDFSRERDVLVRWGGEVTGRERAG